MTDVKLDHCELCGWTIFPENQYCGWCGCSLIDLDLENPESDPCIYMVDKELWIQCYCDELTEAFTVRMKNKGKFSLAVRAVQGDMIRIEPHEVTVNPHWESKGENFKIEFIQQNDQVVEKQIPLKWIVSQNCEKELGYIKVLPKPKIIADPSTITIDLASNDSVSNLDIGLLLYGISLEVNEISASERFVKCSGFTGHWEANSRHNIGLTIKCSEIPRNVDSLNLTILIKACKRRSPIAVSIPLMIQKTSKPEIKLIPLSNQVNPGSNHAVELRIRNLGELSFVLKSIEFLIRDIADAVNGKKLEHQVIDPDWHLPRTIAPAGSDTAMSHRITLITSELNPAKFYNVTFAARTDSERDPNITDEFVLRVLPVKEFGGYVAIDFGTTNSICAIWDPLEKQPRLCHLDEKEQKTNPDIPAPIPSWIFYEDFDHQNIGFEAKNKALDIKNNTKILHTMKRRLGETEKIYTIYMGASFREYTPSQVVTDYCRVVKQISEKTDGKWTGVAVFSYPTTFRLFQSNDIRRLARNLGFKDEYLEFIDEARAVAYYAMNQPHVNIRESEFFMVFDIGGGTTDVAICQRIGGTFKVLDVAGDGRFGGDDITRLIEKQLIEEIEIKSRPGVLYNLDRNTLSGSEEREKTAENRYFLEQEATKIKHLWTSYRQNPQIRVLPKVWIKEGEHFVESIRVDLPSMTLKISQIEEEISQRLDAIFQDVEDLLTEHDINLDKIILAGQGIKFPLIPERMKARFPVEVIEIDEPKGAVALGALHYVRQSKTEGKRIDHKPRTRFAYGLEKTKEMKMIFDEYIPRNALIPTKSPPKAIDFNSRSRNFTIWERWGIASPEDLGNMKFRIYAPLSYDIPAGLFNTIDLTRCQSVMRVLKDDTVSLCLIFTINDLAGLIDYVSAFRMHLSQIRNSYCEADPGIRDPEDFHTDVLDYLDNHVCFIKEFNPAPRGN